MFIEFMQNISLYAIPLIILIIPSYAFVFKKVKIYEVFTEGAKEGFTTSVRIIPYLVAMLVAIGIFRASGAMQIFVNLLQPITTMIGMPPELVPMAIMKPLSGGGATGILNDLLIQFGPDSLIGRMASTLQGSTETTFYVIAVYFGSVGVRKTRHAITAGLLADLSGLLATVWICNMMF